MLVPFLYASVLFWWRGSIIVWSVSAVAMLPILVHYSPHLEALGRNIVFSILPLTAVVIVVLELRWRERQREIMAEREKERQIYMAQIFQAQEDERKRIAQELHDETTQELIVIANHVQSLFTDIGKLSKVKVTKEKTEQIKNEILHVSENVRRLSRDLRPSILDNMGLLSALRWLADRINIESEIDTKVVVTGQVKNLSPEIEATIFRIVQEAMRNIRRHSQASEAVVSVVFERESIKIAIEDNGIGFILTEAPSSLATQGKLGIIGMEQRVKFLKGTFEIKSRPGKGTLISIDAIKI